VRALRDVVRKGDRGACLASDFATGRDEVVCGHVVPRTTGAEVDAELRADDHERVAHVVARIPHEGELAATQVLAELLLHGEHIGEHLRGMKLRGETVPDGHAGIRGQRLDLGLLEPTVLDSIIHATEDACRVLDGLLLAHLRAAGFEIGDAHAKVHATNLEGAARTCRGLLEEQHDVLALEIAVWHASVLLRLEIRREREKIAYLGGREVEKLEKAPAREVDVFHVPVLSSGTPPEGDP